MKDGANRRQKVDEIVKSFGQGRNVDVPNVQATLMESFRILDRNSEAERDAFKDILAANVLLSKAVGEMVTEVTKLRREVDFLKTRR